jgi:hypothetical protein
VRRRGRVVLILCAYAPRASAEAVCGALIPNGFGRQMERIEQIAGLLVFLLGLLDVFLTVL